MERVASGRETLSDIFQDEVQHKFFITQKLMMKQAGGECQPIFTNKTGVLFQP